MNCNELWAIVSDEPGEGIVTFGTSLNSQLPIVRSVNDELMEAMVETARKIAAQTGRKMRIVHYVAHDWEAL